MNANGRLKIYVAGQYSSSPATNSRLARACGAAICWKGHIPVIPHTMYHGIEDMPHDPGYDFWLMATLELLKCCDAIYMMPLWERSNGAVLEHEHAIKAGKTVFYGLDDICHARVK